MVHRSLLSTLFICVLGGCGSSSGGASAPPVASAQPNVPSPADLSQKAIHVNQLGYLADGEKIAIIPDVSASTFMLINKDNGNLVLEGALSDVQSWQPAGDKKVKQVDFSTLQQSGTYTLQIAGLEDKDIAIIEEDYQALHDAAIKSYYFNRASTEITEALGSEWARPAGHLDTTVMVHESAATEARKVGDIFASEKGWYDAGDFGKYVVNSGIATYTLMAAYEHHPDMYRYRDLSIPESGDELPDFLDEIKWNLDWLSTMQAPNGSVYHKLTTLKWPGKEMPNEDERQRYAIGKSTSAALNFAATMAVASRIFKPYGNELGTLSDAWLAQAESAWRWAVSNPNVAYVQPADVSSGEYGDDYFKDEFAWAAAELFITTEDDAYLVAFNEYQQEIVVPSWQYVAALGPISLLRVGSQKINEPLHSQLTEQVTHLADEFLSQYQTSAYKVAMVSNDFVWGSNSVVLNKALILLQAYHLTGESAYRDAAIGSLSYILGRNPTGYSFVTGFGDKTPVDPHHRASVSDNVDAPIPGMLAGGPHSGQQDECSYPSKEAALSYVDDWCSYSTNEVAINWNAPLVYVLASLLSN